MVRTRAEEKLILNSPKKICEFSIQIERLPNNLITTDSISASQFEFSMASKKTTSSNLSCLKNCFKKNRASAVHAQESTDTSNQSDSSSTTSLESFWSTEANETPIIPMADATTITDSAPQSTREVYLKRFQQIFAYVNSVIGAFGGVYAIYCIYNYFFNDEEGFEFIGTMRRM